MTGRDIEGLLNEIARWETGSELVPHRLVNLGGLTEINLRFADIWEIAQRRKACQFPNAFRSALVVANDIQLGFARMFQTLNDHPQVEVRVFTSLAEAEAWLTIPHE